MSNSILSKNFKHQDVRRLRNLITGNETEKTNLSVGYEKKKEFYIEGDIWEEDGRQWTIKNGIKQNITKLDSAKKLINVPIFCSCCKNLMKHKYDKLFYIQYKRCFNCQIDFETNLRKLGLWEEYEKNILNSDIDHVIEDYNVWINELINTSNDSFISENGDIEIWNGSAKQKLLQNKDETIKYLQSLKK